MRTEEVDEEPDTAAEGAEGRAPTTGVSYAHLPRDVREQWYAAALSRDLPAARAGLLGSRAPRPSAMSLLGDPIALWRDASGAVRCVADKCPHRSVPLSLGSVNGDAGTLECLYHGWQVDGSTGRVVRIPALLSGQSVPACARVRTYPTFEQDGLVYVWPGTPEKAVDAEKPARDSRDDGLPFRAPGSGYSSQLVCMDLPIDHSLMVENLLDPAHIPFAHEGTIGKRKNAIPLQMKLEKTRRGFRGSVKDGFYNSFEAPSTIVLHTPPVPGKMDLYQYVACTPTAPGQFRMVYRAYRNFATWVDRVPALRRLFDVMTRKIVFQDYNLLLGQQQRLNEHALAWNGAIQVDVLPRLYRNYWKRTFGKLSKDGPWWRGWDGSLDVEDLDRLGAWDRDFDCNGCAVPRRPHHPQNILEVPGAPGAALRPSPPAGRPWATIFSALALATAVAALARR